MNEEERYDEKNLLQELSTDKARRSNILISLNCSLQRTERIVANIKDMRELQEYKIAVVSVESELKKTQQENQQLKEKLEQEYQKHKEVIDKTIEWIKKKINSCTIEAESTTKDTMCKITISGLYNLLNILEEVE